MRQNSLTYYQISDYADFSLEHPIQETLEGKREYYECEIRMRHKDGRWIWVLDQGYVAMRDAQGNPLRMAGSHVDISRLKQLQDEVHNRAEEFESIYNGLTDAVLVAEAGTHEIIGCNIAVQELTGKRSDELLGASIESLLSQDSLEELFQQSALHTSGALPLIASELLCITGRRIHVTIKPSFISYKSTWCILLVIRDVTEERLANEQLREREEKYRSMFENIQDVYAEVEAGSGIILDISPSIEQYGFKREELLGTSITGYYPFPEERERLYALLQEKSRVVDHEVHFCKKNGELLVFSFVVEVVAGNDGHPSKIVGTMRDITERKRFEEKLKKQANQLEALYNGLTDAVFIADVDTKEIMACNSVAEKMIGRSAHELIGLTVETLHPPDEVEKTLKEFELLGKGLLETVDAVLSGSDGSRIPVSIKSSTIEYNNRQCVMRVMRDISISKRHEAIIKENLKLKNDFISMVSHELRTPLFSILGFSSTLLKGNEKIDTTTREEFLHIIHDESTRLSMLIDDVLTISRIDADKRKYEPVALNPESIINDVVKILQRMGQEKGIEIRTEFPESVLHIVFDRNALKQVMMNLISNAIRAPLFIIGRLKLL